MYVRDGIIINPEKLFFEERKPPDIHIDCQNAIICAGFIDIQINGKSLLLKPSKCYIYTTASSKIQSEFIQLSKLNMTVISF